MRQNANSWKSFVANKSRSRDELVQLLPELRAHNKTIATLNGSFDLLHAGHMYMLYEAAQTADILIVALNTDTSIQRYKSPSRPIITLSHRIEMMCALTMVDYVSWFEEDDPREFLTHIKPDVHVNGAEYGERCIEAEVVRSFGGTLHLVPRIPSLATSSIITKIQSL